MKDKWLNFWRLSWHERWLLMLAGLLLPLTAVALRSFGLRRWQSILAGLTPLAEKYSTEEREGFRQRAQATARLVRAAAEYGPFRSSCLAQSLSLWWLLRRQGIRSILRIGVRKEGSQLEAHAWVEMFGLALNETDDIHQHFTAFDDAFPPARTKTL